MVPGTPIETRVHREPFALSFRRPSRSILSRFLAHVLIRLLIVSALPANLQAASVLFPVSMLWPLVGAGEAAPAPDVAACYPETRVRGSGLAGLPFQQGSLAAKANKATEIEGSGRLWKHRTQDTDPEVGRFISQDSFLGQVDDPPSLHRYFYANDNPTRYVDPTGHDSELADAAEREQARRAALAAKGQAAPSFTTDQGGRIVPADGPVVVPDRGPRGTTLDELPADQRAMLDQEAARLRREQADRRGNAPQTVQEERSLVSKYREKREELKQWAQRKAEQGADSLTKPVEDPVAEARKEELRRATEGTSAEQAGGALADRNIAKGVNETAVEGSGIAAREGTELAMQYAETEVGLRAAGVAIGGLRSVRRGLAGEEAVANEIGVARNAGPGRVTVPGTGRGGYRIPDFPPGVTLRVRGTVVEVKNVKDLSITPQLRDLARYAQSKGATLEVFTNAPIPKSGQLRDLIDAEVVRIVPLSRR